MSRLGTIVVAVLAVAGCASTPGLSDELRQRIREQCLADVPLRWRSPLPSDARLLYIPTIEDPATTGGRIVPARYAYSFDAEPALYLEALSLDSLYVYISAREPASKRFAPVRPARSGIYRLEVRPRSEGGCEAYDRGVDARRQDGLGAIPIRRPAQEHCLAFTFLGELSDLDYTHLVTGYRDEEARNLGYYRRVSEIRSVGGELFARTAVYVSPSGDPLTCTPDGRQLNFEELID